MDNLKQPLKAGDKIEVEVCPGEGQYKAETVDGTPFTERFTPESMQAIVDNWEKDGSRPVLCDIDHSSADTSNTEAAGWLDKLWYDPDRKRLMASMTVSEKGASVLSGLDYRYLSPVLLFRDDDTPYYLDSVALTNTPRLKELRPVYNSESHAGQKMTNDGKILLDPEAAKVDNDSNDGKPSDTETKPPETKNGINEIQEDEIKTMEEIKVILGLPAEAAEEDVKASIRELVEKLKAVTEKEVEAEAEVAASECGVEDELQDEVKNCYRENPGATRKLIEVLKKSKAARAAKAVANAKEAVKPALQADEAKEYKGLKGGKEKLDYLMKHPGLKL